MVTQRRWALNLQMSVLVSLVGCAVAVATDPPAAPEVPTGPDLEAWRRAEVGESVINLATTPMTELSLRITPMRLTELDAMMLNAANSLEVIAKQLVDGMIDLLHLGEARPPDDHAIAALTERVKSLREIRSALLSRCNILLLAVEEKGGSPGELRAYLAAIQKLEPEAGGSASPTAVEKPEDEMVEERVAAAIARVREMPPVHERSDPWTVSINELELELQPLRKDQIDERIQQWLAILQRELRQRIRMDIAVAGCEDDAERQALADKSAEQQQVVQAIVNRTEAVLKVLQKRGGEVTDYQRYIANATGQKLNLADPAVLLAQVKSWIRSPEGGIKIGLNILKFLGILVMFWLASRVVSALVSAAARRAMDTSSLLQRFIRTMSRRLIMIVGLVVAISALGININPLVAAIGAAGLVIGLALQGTLSNFASGMLILITRPFDVGDVISAGGVSGKVDAMNLVSTRILTFDNQVMLVPNNEIWNGVITNVTALGTRRVDLVFGIGYSDDIAKAQGIIESVLSDHPQVLKEPAPVVKVHELADNSVNFIVRPWAATTEYWNVHWDVTRQIKQAFDEQGINIPFPQRDLHLRGPIDVVLKSNGNASEMAGA